MKILKNKKKKLAEYCLNLKELKIPKKVVDEYNYYIDKLTNYTFEMDQKNPSNLNMIINGLDVIKSNIYKK